MKHTLLSLVLIASLGTTVYATTEAVAPATHTDPVATDAAVPLEHKPVEGTVAPAAQATSDAQVAQKTPGVAPKKKKKRSHSCTSHCSESKEMTKKLNALGVGEPHALASAEQRVNVTPMGSEPSCSGAPACHKVACS